VARATALKEDASLAAFYLLSLALGVTIVSLRGSNVDLLHVLFGTVLALDDAALLLLGGIATVTLVTLALLYRPLVIECVDPAFLRSVSRAGTPVHLVFLGLLVLNLVGGFQALGTLLAVGLMMLPAAAARFWSAEVSIMTLVATGIGLLSSLVGLLVSFHAELPAGPAIVLAAGAVYAVSLAFGREGGLFWLAWPGRHLEA
jgi:zinc/manganese transport system permease protein